MTIYRSNSEYWYADRQPLLKRIRRWLVSSGWETPRWTPAGYTYRWQARRAAGLALRARGHRSRLFALYSSLCPLSLFGGRITFQPFGVSYYSRRVRGWYCLNHGMRPGGARWYAFRSHNCTPWGADTWYIGAPAEVVRAADQQAAHMSADREQREARDSAAQRRRAV